jgi:hypothetical protein
MTRFFLKTVCVTFGAFLSPWQALSAPFSLSLDGNAVARVTATRPISNFAFDSSLITSAFPGWTVNKVGTLSGITTISNNAGWKDPNLGGGKLQARYAQSDAVPAGSTLNWLQVINTNLPLNGPATPYLDPRPNDDSLPFYWTTAEQAARSTTTSVTFEDFATRTKSALATTNPITFRTQLFVAEFNGNNTVSVRNGISWGWDIKRATIGDNTGAFVGPSPTCPPATCSGIGSNKVTWGDGDSSSLSFSGSAFAPTTGDVFKLGTLTYHNGVTPAGTIDQGLDFVGLDFALRFTNISEANFTYHSVFNIVTTQDSADPEASADYVSFSTDGIPFRVFEGDTQSVDIIAKLTPRFGLELPADFALGGDKDLDQSILLTPIGFDLEFVKFGVVAAPSTYLLFLLGLVAIFFSKKTAHGDWRMPVSATVS